MSQIPRRRRRSSNVFDEPRSSQLLQSEEARNIFALIDEYIEDAAPVIAATNETPQVQPENNNVPVIDVPDSEDFPANHDSMAPAACLCRTCKRLGKRARTVDEVGHGNGVHELLVKCGICLSATSDGGRHHPHALRCGHIFGRVCIKAWLDGKAPSTCPTCNKFSIEAELIKLHGSSARQDIMEEAVKRAKEVDKVEETYRDDAQKSQELIDLLFDCINRTGDALKAEKAKNRKP